MIEKLPCRHCTSDHTYVCDCGRSHNDHAFGGGCEATRCEVYSQRHQRLPDESQQQYAKRILAKPKKVKA
jgi:hypothetical protein